MVVDAGNAGVRISNDLASNESLFAQDNQTELEFAGGVFLVKVFLHLNFNPNIRIGKRYSLVAG